MRRLILLMVLWLIPFVVSAQETTLPPVTPAQVTGDIATGGGRDIVPLIENIAARFRSQGYSGNIGVSELGTSVGIERMCSGELDIANAARIIAQGEVAFCVSQGKNPFGFQIGTGALAIVVHPQNAFINGLTTEELIKVFTTAINWSDVRSDFPSDPINRYIPAQNTDALENFARLLFNGNTSTLVTALGARSIDPGLIARSVEADLTAIGVVPYSLIANNRVKIVSIDRVSPDIQTVANGQYKLTYPVLLYSTSELMQSRGNISSYINYAIQNANQDLIASGMFPVSESLLEGARQSWVSAMRATTAVVPTPLPEVTEEFGEFGDGEEIVDGPAPEPTPSGPPNALDIESVVVLVDARADLELLANATLPAGRPVGWSGSVDINNPQLAVLVRLDLELLAGALYGSQRPGGWFGAVRSTPNAIARDIRHDLELLADAQLSANTRPEGWTGFPDPLVKCDRSTQTLISLLRRGDLVTITLDPSTPNYCERLALEAATFSERVLLTGSPAQAIFAIPIGELLPGSITIDTNFAVAFLDRFANQNVGVIPIGTSLTAVARSYAQFSNMTVVQGDGFIVYVDWRDTTLTERAFRDLPDIATRTDITPFCRADFCR